jgi:flagellar hook-associated protein FlgK
MNFITLLAQTTAPDGIPLWASILIGLAASGVLTAIINFWPSWKKLGSETEKADAEAADIIQRAAGDLITRIQHQATEAEKKNEERNHLLVEQNNELSRQIAQLQVQVEKIPILEAKISELSHGIDILTDQLKEHGINPIYPPSPPPF